MPETMTAPDLLQAVGVDWRTRDGLYEWDNGLTCTCIYTGPALYTPELDAILWVGGQRWCVANIIQSESWRITDKLMDQNHDPINDTCYREIPWLLLACKSPGHALARAIKEVRG